MPQIIVTADQGSDPVAAAVIHRERVSASDFESGHFQAQLVERIGWAVGDADTVEHRGVGAGAVEPPQARIGVTESRG